MRRGAFIVLEGCDRSGKSTQCKRLLEMLGEDGVYMKFPDRSTTIGNTINEYLQKGIEMHDKAIHLLFSANRWEKVSEIERLLTSGKTIIADRYAYSGVAYSSIKSGLNLDWCKSSDVGLIRPDLVLYLSIDSRLTMSREGFGDERYERIDIQSKVHQRFLEMKEDYWKIIDASKSIDNVFADTCSLVRETVDKVSDKQLQYLWI